MQVSDQIIEVLDYICKKLGLTIDWTSENVLPYVQTLCNKYINWEIASSIIWIVIGVVCIILSVILIRKINDDDLLLFLFASLVAGVIIIGVQAFDIVKCIYFPELQLFEYVQTLLNS